MTFLNPDEALHYFLAHQPTLRLAYEASLTTAHPPLVILFLHTWSRLGSSEFFLRLPFVVAGTVFCWLMFLWLRKVTSNCAACFALVLFLFLPPLISLSAEIRQYAFLLLFCAVCLYFLEGALSERSIGLTAVSAISLWLALLTHYSALIFAASVSVYALLRIVRKKVSAGVIAVWIAGQLAALAICVFLFKSQISPLRRSGVPSEIAATWLRGSIFHPGEDHLFIFAWGRSLRLFRYFFSNGTIGLLGLLLFLFAILLMLRGSLPKDERRNQRELGILLLLPFLLTLGTAIAGVYPYGGSRHDVLLVLFAIPGIAIGLDQLPLAPKALSKWLKPALLGCALIIGNLHPSPTGPYIRPHNQRRDLMQQATSTLRSLPTNSVIFTDDQGSMVLNYYLCGESMALPSSSQTPAFLRLRCGDHDVLVATGTQTLFNRAQFSQLLAAARQQVPSGTALYLFQSGWIDDKENEWLAELRDLGGVPQNFGPNVLISKFESK
jgi:Dolichyl-phosphate-mannose-protein mannosyltransferase